MVWLPYNPFSKTGGSSRAVGLGFLLEGATPACAAAVERRFLGCVPDHVTSCGVNRSSVRRGETINFTCYSVSEMRHS